MSDLRYAARSLVKTPGFTATAVLTLALGIGGSTAIFTVVDSVLLRPLRFAEPQRLTMIWTTVHSRVPPRYLHDWRLESRTFEDLAGWHDVRANLTGRGEPLEVLADRVTPNFFAVLGTPALLGRTFTVKPSLSAVEPEVILSHGFWQRRFGGDPHIVGQPITLDGESFTIIGVMPEGLTVRTLELSESRAELWMPFPLIPDDRYGVIAFNVTQRTQEIGVRVALGAQYRDVLRLVMQRGMLLTGTGLVIGTAAALAVGRIMAGLLYGITPTDPATLVAVALFLAAVAMLATYLPAHRAARVEPLVALRYE